MEQVEYKGKRAIKIVEDGDVPNGEAYAIVKAPTFHNGEISVELAGLPAGASAAAGGAWVHRNCVQDEGRALRVHLLAPDQRTR